MNKNDVIRTIRSQLPVLKSQYGVNGLFLYGSFAKDIETDSSDVDLMVEASGVDKTLQNYLGAINLLEKHLQRHVDYVYSDSMNPIIKLDIQKDLIKIE